MELYEELTPCEVDVLRLLAAGLTTGEMAERLCLTKSGVNFHLENLMAKAGLPRGSGEGRLQGILAHFCEITVKAPYRRAVRRRG